MPCSCVGPVSMTTCTFWSRPSSRHSRQILTLSKSEGQTCCLSAGWHTSQDDGRPLPPPLPPPSPLPHRTALETIEKLSQTVDFSDYASQVLHAIVVILDTTSELRPAAMDALCSLMTQLSQRYKIFIPMVKKVSEFADGTVYTCTYHVPVYTMYMYMYMYMNNHVYRNTFQI